MGKSESSADEVAAEEVGAAGVPEVTPPPTGPPAEDDGRAKKPSFAFPCFPRSDKDLNIAADDSPREGDAAAPAPQKGFKLSLPWKKGAGEAVAPGEAASQGSRAFTFAELKAHPLFKIIMLSLALLLLFIFCGGVAASQQPWLAQAHASSAAYFSAGTVSIGVISCGSTLGTGMFSIGFISIGVFSTGVFSIGLFSVGFFSIGLASVGHYALGMWAWGIVVRFGKSGQALESATHTTCCGMGGPEVEEDGQDCFGRLLSLLPGSAAKTDEFLDVESGVGVELPAQVSHNKPKAKKVEIKDEEEGGDEQHDDNLEPVSEGAK